MVVSTKLRRRGRHVRDLRFKDICFEILVKILVLQSLLLAREDTNHTFSEKAKMNPPGSRDGFLIQATSRLDWFGSPAALIAAAGEGTTICY
jgi:hypothetical protein